MATALLLVAGNVAALGLGQIEVKSRLNQPLLAEIPIISTVPGELEALQARLASPETFRRIGLAPPSGVAADLQFSLGSDARGRPVIRVTTTAPVNQAVLNFLIEVDWGQGRLVREYSALVDAPRTASAAVQPAISAPVVAAPNVVQRPAPSVAAPVATPAPVAPAVATLPPPVAAPAPEPAAASTAIEPLPPPARAMPAPVPAPVAVPPGSAVASVPAPAQYGPVKRGESLSEIASQLPLPSGYSLDQAMLALLRANPEAFLGDDVNQLRQGAVLRVPGASELAGVSADEAALVVREQMREWRQARRPVVQPQAAAASASATRTSALEAAQPRAARAPTARAPAAAPAARRQVAQARLAIVPPSAPGKATGTRSGTSAGGEGTMLQQQLRQRDEDLAARTVEIGELKDRVAELEKLQQQQQQLLAMKDSELAAAQQRLAATRKAEAAAAALPAAPGAAQAQATAQPAGPVEPAPASGPMPWIWGSLALLGLALLAWLLMRRSSRPAPQPRRVFDSEALAASMVAPQSGEQAGAAMADDALEDAPAVAAAAPAGPHPVQAAPDVVIDLDEVPSTMAPRVDAPTWHSGRWVNAAPEPPVELAAAAPSFVPPEDNPAPAPQASAAQRLKLALAFFDIGDDQSAQQLLRELLDDADPSARMEAARLLRERG